MIASPPGAPTRIATNLDFVAQDLVDGAPVTALQRLAAQVDNHGKRSLELRYDALQLGSHRTGRQRAIRLLDNQSEILQLQQRAQRAAAHTWMAVFIKYCT